MRDPAIAGPNPPTPKPIKPAPHLKLLKIKFLPRHSKVLDHVGHNAPWHITSMPRKRNQPIRPIWVALMPMTSRRSNQLTTDLLQPPLQLPTTPRRKFSSHSSSQNELLPERRGNGSTRLHQSLQMRLGRLLKTQNRLPTVFAMRMTPLEQLRLSNPHPIFILA